MLKASDLYESSILWISANPTRALELAKACEFDQVVQDVDSHQVHNLIGTCYTKGDANPVESYKRFKIAANQDPSCVQYKCNLAFANMMLYDAETAERITGEALRQDENYEDSYVKMTNAKSHQGKYQEAYQTQLEYIKRFDNPFNRMALGLTELLLSDMKDREMFERGVKSFEGRLDRYEAKLIGRYTGDLQGLHGEVIRVYLEQGLGDCVMFIPYLQKLAGIASHLAIVSPEHDSAMEVYKTLGCFPDNVKFFNSKECKVLTNDLDVYELWMFDLLKLGLPYEVCYQIPTVGNTNGKIGFCWRGNPSHPNDWWRSMRFRDIIPFIEKHGNKIISLQSNLTTVEREILLRNGVEIAPEITDYSVLAKVISDMKAVVTIDSFISHFSGILGVPCYTLVTKSVDWRWGMSGRKTDWYSNHTILRQKKCGDWGGLFAELDSVL